MRILITGKIPAKGIELLEAAGHKLTVPALDELRTQEQLIRLCEGQDAVFSVGANQLDGHFFENCQHLKAVALMSAGYDNVDIASATFFKIPVSNLKDVLSKATADTAFLLMLAVSRNAFNRHKIIERGEWTASESTANLGIELYGKTLGIFGLGSIGLELAIKAKAAFQMKIVYHNRKRNLEADELEAQFVSFNELLTQSDVVSVHANLSEDTRGLFNHAVFERMKPSSIFINTARGAIHQEEDLIEALKAKTIWGAGLDVTDPEPMLKDNPLLNLPNVCVLPHIGSATEETRTKMAEMAAQNIIAALNGVAMPQIINPVVYE